MAKRSSGDISGKSKNTLESHEYYLSIEELPLYNWIKCSDGQLKYCRKSEAGDEIRDAKAWENIYDNYIKIYGLNKMYQKMLKTMLKKAEAELEYCISGDRFKLTEAEIQEQQLEQMLRNKGSGMTIDQTLIHLSKWIGQWLNPKNITTQEYFNLLGEFEKHNKANKDG